MEFVTWILLIIVGFGLYLVGLYNGLITLRNRVQEAVADIEVQLKRRYDLIPNLLETVKGYVKHEKETLQAVTEARTAAMKISDVVAKGEMENQLSQTLKSLFAVSENYPDLKANQNFLEFQRELSDTENKVQASRRFYNGMVRDFNTKLQVFPTNLFGQWLKFVEFKFFALEADERQAATQAPKVKFDA